MIDFGEINGHYSFFFLRHGQSVGNERRIAQGQVDFPLTDVGRAQAARAAHWLEDQEIDLILSSSLRRAVETAEIVASHLELDGVEIRPELLEIDVGLFSGLRWDEVEEQYPQEQRSFFRHWWDGVPGAETSEALYDRGQQVWRLLFDYGRQGSSRILTITHSGLLQWIVKSTLGNRSWFPVLPMDNCSVYQLTVQNQIVPPSTKVRETTPFRMWRWNRMGQPITLP
jgi:broad specificity phosphatase PhoE